jgi:hypothetical protein
MLIQTEEKWKWGGYTDASDEEGRQTPSTETRPLFAIVHVLLLPSGLPDFDRMTREMGKPVGFLIDFRHSASRAQATVDHVLWAEARGMRRDVHYEIVEVARAVGAFAHDEHGEHLYM